MSRLSLWLQPEPGSFANLASEGIRALGNQTGAIFDPHITVIGGFDADETQAATKAQELAATFGCLDVEFEHFGFEDVLVRAAYLTAVPSTQLQALRAKAGELFTFPAAEYLPHLSLMYADNIAEPVRRQLVAGLGIDLPVAGRFSRLGLWRTALDSHAPDFSRWSQVDEFQLPPAGF